jgi:hypothetical protein
MYLITFFINPKKALTINNLPVKGYFRDGKDTKCWISTGVQSKENAQNYSVAPFKMQQML